MNSSVSEEESQELTENEDTEPRSNIYFQNEINQYDNLLKDNETYRQRMKKFQDLQSDLINWLRNGNGISANMPKNQNDNENNFPKIKSPSDIEFSSFSVAIRPYHNDAIIDTFTCT